MHTASMDAGLMTQIEWVRSAMLYMCNRDSLMKAADAAYLASALWRLPSFAAMTPTAAVDFALADDSFRQASH